MNLFHFRITGNRPAQHDMEDSLPEFTPLFNKYILFITKVIYFFSDYEHNLETRGEYSKYKRKPIHSPMMNYC